MKQASRQFTEDDLKRINDAVADAESRTSAEIVPVVATASGRYDRAEDIVGLWLGLLAMLVAWILLPKGGHETGNFSDAGSIHPLVKPIVLVAAMLAGFVSGAIVASRTGWLRRLFTPRREMSDETLKRARQIFFDSRVHHTSGATGLLVYVSLYERMAAVLADGAILDKLGQPALDELCGQLLRDLSGGDITSAICSTITAAGEKLAPLLPRAEDDVNELPNGLVTLEE